MSEPMRDPMRRQLTSGRRSTPAALLPGAPRPSTRRPSPAISARSAWTRRRWRSCQRPGVGRWGSARRVQGSRPPCRRRPGPWCRAVSSAPSPPGRTRTQRPTCSTALTPGTRCDQGPCGSGRGCGSTCEGRDVPSPSGADAADEGAARSARPERLSRKGGPRVDSTPAGAD